MKTALLIGATGLTGNLLLQLLLNNSSYSKVIVYTRRTLGISHPKLEERLVKFDELNTSVQADDVFCCLGTTIKIAGSQAAFEKVDYEYPLKVAKLQQQAGSKQFLVMSAMGASPTSSVFYSRVKGKLEEALQKVGFKTLYIFRPSLIVGNRKEKRFGEKVFSYLFKAINPLMIGGLRKYQSVHASAIAKAMVHFAGLNEVGKTIVLSDEIKKFE